MKHLYFVLLMFLFPTLQFAQGGDANAPDTKEQKMYYFVFFDAGKSNLAAEEWSKLEAFIWDVKLSNPKVSRIDIHGYTDGSKLEKKYPTIAADRAAIVKDVINGFGIPAGLTFTTKGGAISKDEPADAALKRRATVCVYYTGTIKRNQGQKADPALDPNFDKKIVSTPTELAKPAKKEEASATKPEGEKKPVPQAPKPAPKKKAGSSSNWE